MEKKHLYKYGLGIVNDMSFLHTQDPYEACTLSIENRVIQITGNALYNKAKANIELEKSGLYIEQIACSGHLEASIDIIVPDNTQVTYITGIDFTCPTGIIERSVTLGKQASIRLISLYTHPDHIKETIVVNLAQEGSTAELYGLFYGKETQVFDISHSVHMQAARTTAHLYTKGVLDDFSKTIFQGNITMTEQARGSVGTQKEETLLLSDGAEIDAVPHLDIQQKNVQCSHGVSVSRLTDERLFYLQSRGLEKDHAVGLAINSFLSPIVEMIADPTIQEKVHTLLEKKRI